MTPAAIYLADVIKNDPASKAHHDAAAAELRRLHALNLDLLALAHQYANDMRYPPTADSRQRRLAAVEAVLSKVKS